MTAQAVPVDRGALRRRLGGTWPTRDKERKRGVTDRSPPGRRPSLRLVYAVSEADLDVREYAKGLRQRGFGFAGTGEDVRAFGNDGDARARAERGAERGHGDLNRGVTTAPKMGMVFGREARDVPK